MTKPTIYPYIKGVDVIFMQTSQLQNQQELERQYDDLYEKFGKPFEKKHKGKYLAISQRGEILLGTNLSEVSVKADEKFGAGNFVYKVGERSVGKWR